MGNRWHVVGCGKVLNIRQDFSDCCGTGQAALLSGGDWSPHKIQGWTPDFIPDVLEKEIVDKQVR